MFKKNKKFILSIIGIGIASIIGVVSFSYWNKEKDLSEYFFSEKEIRELNILENKCEQEIRVDDYIISLESVLAIPSEKEDTVYAKYRVQKDNGKVESSMYANKIVSSFGKSNRFKFGKNSYKVYTFGEYKGQDLILYQEIRKYAGLYSEFDGYVYLCDELADNEDIEEEVIEKEVLYNIIGSFYLLDS